MNNTRPNRKQPNSSLTIYREERLPLFRFRRVFSKRDYSRSLSPQKINRFGVRRFSDSTLLGLLMGKQKSERDWAGLIPELVTIIAEKASTTNTGYIHLRLICKAWRRALTPNPRHLPPQSPWLLLPRTPADVCYREGLDHSKLTFYDPFQSKTHIFRLPYIRGKSIRGTSHGWLVLEHSWRVSLFNPLTQCTIHLPSLFRDQKGTLWVEKAILSCNPSKDGCVVVASFLSYSSSNWELGFCRIGGTRWTCLRMKDKQSFLIDFTCHKNIVYTFDIKKEVLVYNLQDLSVRTLPSKIWYNSIYYQEYLVEGDSESGEPLLVLITTKYHETTKILVHKWSNNRQQWQPVPNIGKQVLFLNLNNSINLQLEGGRENELYYVVKCPMDHRSYFRLGINQMHLNTGKDVLQIPGPMEEFNSLGENPTWFTPSLI
ncbi:hypothetical protein LUZ61_003236 [Rhynchospora tenuis]|uniref:KIB1-4 beta-propeller domain-containing protein n=1 Tax=Rhynchospora tenuis TaxID=198213 RepID=A0AAD5ZKK9_9POAL|nr:hypothetical protein LUZ61_003236 [Rhynchospora tenuis]